MHCFRGLLTKLEGGHPPEDSACYPSLQELGRIINATLAYRRRFALTGRCPTVWESDHLVLQTEDLELRRPGSMRGRHLDLRRAAPLNVESQAPTSTMGKGSDLNVTPSKEADDNLQVFEQSMEAGHPALVENMLETVDAVLQPVIARNTLISHGTKRVLKLGEKQHPCDEDLLLFVRIVKLERPDLPRIKRSCDLIQQQNEFKVADLEAYLLGKLAGADSDILEDTELVFGLEDAKFTSDEVKEKATDRVKPRSEGVVTFAIYSSLWSTRCRQADRGLHVGPQDLGRSGTDQATAHSLGGGMLYDLSSLPWCIKIADVAPTDLKANLRRANARTVSQEHIACQKPKEFKATLFALDFFHSLVLGRVKFGSQGWSKKYPFNDGDLTIYAQVLCNYLNNAESGPFPTDVPWQLRYITDQDRRVLRKTSELPALLTNMSLARFKLPDASKLEYSSYQTLIEEPQLFGLHPNAEIGFLTSQGINIFKTVQMVSGDTAAATMDLVACTPHIAKYKDDLPQDLDMAEIRGRLREEDCTPQVLEATTGNEWKLVSFAFAYDQVGIARGARRGCRRDRQREVSFSAASGTCQAKQGLHPCRSPSSSTSPTASPSSSPTRIQALSVSKRRTSPTWRSSRQRSWRSPSSAETVQLARRQRSSAKDPLLNSGAAKALDPVMKRLAEYHHEQKEEQVAELQKKKDVKGSEE
ncbi:unnamed protein product [Durusdinium trenchii]|uniref:Uncharacterized protein n=1 Tax=Durusdinium trenchii TaxID=1381693 RepID=A0ABP0MFZ6_9DINO